MSDWSFLTNHGLVLTYVARQPDSTGLEIARAVGITERAVRAIVADLRMAGFLDAERLGRRNRYRINPIAPLRHVGGYAVSVGELLELLWRGNGNDRVISSAQETTTPTDLAEQRIDL